MNIIEQRNRIKELNEQLTINLGTRTRHISRDKYYDMMDKDAKKQERIDDKNIARDEKNFEREVAKYNKEETRKLFSSRYDYLGNKLNKSQIQLQQNEYDQNKNNPNLLNDKSVYDVETRFIVINKIAKQLGGNPNNWFVTKMNKLFNRGNETINTQQLLGLILDPKIGGFDKFMEMYDAGFPQVDLWK